VGEEPVTGNLEQGSQPFKFVIKEYGTVVPVSESMVLPTYGGEVLATVARTMSKNMARYLSLTNEERRQEDKVNAAFQVDREHDRLAKRKAMGEKALARWQIARDCTEATSLVRSLVDLHKPDASNWREPECDGCGQEVGGYEYDMEEWPCATFRLIEEAL
jgi:hypothetical protein